MIMVARGITQKLVHLTMNVPTSSSYTEMGGCVIKWSSQLTLFHETHDNSNRTVRRRFLCFARLGLSVT